METCLGLVASGLRLDLRHWFVDKKCNINHSQSTERGIRLVKEFLEQVGHVAFLEGGQGI